MQYEFNQVYKEDCDIALPKLVQDGIKFDLILTDPPYNLRKDFGNDSDKLELNDFIEVNKRRLAYCSDLMDKNASIVWFGIHHYIGFIQTMMYELGLSYKRMNIWYYENGFSRTKKTPATQYEPFLWFSKSDKKWTYNADDVRVPYKSADRLKTPVYYKNSKGETKKWVPNPLGALRGDVWSYPTLAGKNAKKERTEHPTQKPISLILDIIKAHCPKNKDGFYEGKILDPFFGSGTLGVCCEILNKEGHNIQWMGFEIEEKWVAITNQRISEVRETLV
ncbi:DNA-methyltransferase [Oceanobacillus massiliensis]|uniref:DNA-methyltransferase n=1 Tax=Oceanobacillus massiliensis TaxID=1465765 RepID=UPI00028915AC|nr:site-specific DNA-methyltransferase [Oceanobacillus massiliensis]